MQLLNAYHQEAGKLCPHCPRAREQGDWTVWERDYFMRQSGCRGIGQSGKETSCDNQGGDHSMGAGCNQPAPILSPATSLPPYCAHTCACSHVQCSTSTADTKGVSVSQYTTASPIRSGAFPPPLLQEAPSTSFIMVASSPGSLLPPEVNWAKTGGLGRGPGLPSHVTRSRCRQEG